MRYTFMTCTGLGGTLPCADILGQDFYLNDDQRTRFANLRDVFAHRIGVPRHDDLRLAGYDLQEFVGFVKFEKLYESIVKLLPQCSRVCASVKARFVYNALVPGSFSFCRTITTSAIDIATRTSCTPSPSSLRRGWTVERGVRS